MRSLFVKLVTLAMAGLAVLPVCAQVTPAAGVTPADDTPSVKVGGTIFADWTYIDSPQATDADGNKINASSFNISRAYLNVTGNIFHRASFRITPDVTRETGAGSSLNGSLTYRLKYAYGQYNLDDFTTKGSWIRFGLQQTPWVDYEEGIYRYRFQGPIFVDREGFLTSSDFGGSVHWNFPGNHGDIHAGFYNGDGYSRAEANDQKALQVRASFRPMPLGGIWRGLRFGAFVDEDHYIKSAKRQRYVLNASIEHDRFNAGFDLLKAHDRTSVKTSTVDADGYSAWITPKLPNNFELLLRHDELKPNTDTEQKRKRNIIAISYWMPQRSGVTTAFLLDYDSLQQSGFSAPRPDDTRYGLKLLVNF
jgi:phosphate-selective porin O/P